MPTAWACCSLKITAEYADKKTATRPMSVLRRLVVRESTPIMVSRASLISSWSFTKALSRVSDCFLVLARFQSATASVSSRLVHVAVEPAKSHVEGQEGTTCCCTLTTGFRELLAHKHIGYRRQRHDLSGNKSPYYSFQRAFNAVRARYF